VARDYKDEYEKFQKDKSPYRAKLNKYNRDKGTYGNGDGKDASHNNGEITGFEDSSNNKGKKEKSRLKGSKRNFEMGGYNMNEYEGGTLVGNTHEAGGIPIEAEGGEFIIKRDSVNAGTLDTLEYINRHGDLPLSDARNRSKK
jgi:hypothetical protein|tara:strand:- start:361 stop:789 length:429 start_codon:yes stop_codon:yes gene_type:complete